jgi:REP element-mobilizing transposase RayT
MRKGYTIRNQSSPHFITITVVDWIDLFSRKIYRDVIIDSLRYCQEHKGLVLIAYVIMSNHLHLIVQSDVGKLSDLLRDIKKFTFYKTLSLIKEIPESRADWMLKRFEFAALANARSGRFQVWKSGNHPEEIFSEKFLWSKLNYVHLNPVRAGWVARASDYIYSSAANYVGKEGLLDVKLAPVPIIDGSKFGKLELDSMSW